MIRMIQDNDPNTSQYLTTNIHLTSKIDIAFKIDGYDLEKSLITQEGCLFNEDEIIEKRPQEIKHINV